MLTCTGRMAPEHNVTGGLMAAVGLSAEAADMRLKKEGLGNTVVGCDNSAVNVTLAGRQPLACTRLSHGESLLDVVECSNNFTVKIPGHIHRSLPCFEVVLLRAD